MAKPKTIEIKEYFYRRSTLRAIHISDTDHFMARDVLWSLTGAMYMVLESWTGSRNERMIMVAGKYFKNELLGNCLESLIPVRRISGADVRRYNAQLDAAMEKMGGTV